MKPKSKVLIIAGSDSSGGAGVQADIKTVTSLGSYAMTAVTAVTAQNTTGVKSIIAISPKEISNQIEFSAKDIRPNAVKIGMLHSKEVILAVIKSLKKFKLNNLVLDPVMVAKGGTKLINDTAIIYIKERLMKNSLLITPNIPEAEILAKIKIDSTHILISLSSSNTSSLVKAIPFIPDIFIVCLTKTPSNQPHLLFLAVTVPNSFPLLPKLSPISFSSSVGKGPLPTLVV